MNKNKVKHDKSHQIAAHCLRFDGADTTIFGKYENASSSSREYRRHGWLGNQSYRRPRSNDKKFF